MHVSSVKDKWVSKLGSGSPMAHACLCLKNSINLSIGMGIGYCCFFTPCLLLWGPLLYDK